MLVSASSSGLSTGAIVGIVIGSVAAATVVIGATVYIVRRSQYIWR